MRNAVATPVLAAPSWQALSALGDAAPLWCAGDNGFASVPQMMAAHQPLIAAVAGHAPACAMPLIDLGCGNGALLAALCERMPVLRPVGVEHDGARLSRAPLICTHPQARWVHGDLFATLDQWSQHRPAIIMLMLGRLLEASAEGVETLRQRLRHGDDLILGYAYSDWLARYGGLAALCQATGVTPLRRPTRNCMVVPVAF